MHEVSRSRARSLSCHALVSMRAMPTMGPLVSHRPKLPRAFLHQIGEVSKVGEVALSVRGPLSLAPSRWYSRRRRRPVRVAAPMRAMRALHPWFEANTSPIYGFAFPADMNEAGLVEYCNWFADWYSCQVKSLGMICDLSAASLITPRQRQIGPASRRVRKRISSACYGESPSLRRARFIGAS